MKCPLVAPMPRSFARCPAFPLWDHVGIVESVDSNGTVHTIEGNNTGSNGVAAVRRATYSTNGYSEYSRLSSIRGYGVPNYKGGYVTHTVDSSYGKNFIAYPGCFSSTRRMFPWPLPRLPMQIIIK